MAQYGVRSQGSDDTALHPVARQLHTILHLSLDDAASCIPCQPGGIDLAPNCEQSSFFHSLHHFP